MQLNVPTKRKNAFLTNFKKIDKFGIPIQLRYKNQEHYQTNCGAIATILSYASIVLFIYSMVGDILRKESNVKDAL